MRYIKAAILIGTISAAIVIVLFATGWISTTPDIVLRERIYQMSKPFVGPKRRATASHRAARVRRGVDDGGHHAARSQGGA